MKYEPLIGDSYYHVFNRGNNREDIFLEEKNYPYFLSLLEKHILPVTDIYAYCFLKNHFHLLIKTKDLTEEKFFSRGFSNFFNAYSKAINKAYNRSGSLFQDRFKRKRIENELYLRNLILYIHLNPMNHVFISDFRQYKYSSYSKILSEDESLITSMDVLKFFGDSANFVYAHVNQQEQIKEKEDDFTVNVN